MIRIGFRDIFWFHYICRLWGSRLASEMIDDSLGPELQPEIPDPNIASSKP